MQADKRNFEQSISILTEKLLLGTNAAGPNQTKPNPKNQRKQTKNNGVLSHEVSPQPQTHLIYPGLFSPGPNPPANFLKTHPHTNPTGITLNYVYIFFKLRPIPTLWENVRNISIMHANSSSKKATQHTAKLLIIIFASSVSLLNHSKCSFWTAKEQRSNISKEEKALLGLESSSSPR